MISSSLDSDTNFASSSVAWHGRGEEAERRVRRETKKITKINTRWEMAQMKIKVLLLFSVLYFFSWHFSVWWILDEASESFWYFFQMRTNRQRMKIRRTQGWTLDMNTILPTKKLTKKLHTHRLNGWYPYQRAGKNVVDHVHWVG